MKKHKQVLSSVMVMTLIMSGTSAPLTASSVFAAEDLIIEETTLQPENTASQKSELFLDEPVAEPLATAEVFGDGSEFTSDEPVVEDVKQVEAAGASLTVGQESTDYTYEVLPQDPMKSSATASSAETSTTYNEGPASMAFDNDLNTGWHTTYGQNNGTDAVHWLQWNLAANNESVKVGKLVYSPKSGGQNGIWKDVKIEVTNSDDLTKPTWTEVVTATDLAKVDQTANPPETITFNFTPVEAKAMKVTLTETYYNQQDGMVGSAGEINVYKATDNVVAENVVNVKINDSEYAATSLQDAVSKSQLDASSDDLKSVEFVSGNVTQEDLSYLKNLIYLEKFTLNLSDSLTLTGKDGNQTTIIGPDTAVLEFAAAPAGSSKAKLRTLTLGGFTEIYKYGLKSVASAEKIYLPDIVTVGESAFMACEWVDTINLSSAKTIGNYAFNRLKRLETLTLNAAETLGEGSFAYTDELTKLTLPECIKTIENIKFGIVSSGNKSGTVITIKASTPPTTDNSAFKGVSSISTPSIVVVPHGALQAYLDDTNYKSDATGLITNSAKMWKNLNLMEDGSARIQYRFQPGMDYTYKYAYVPFGEAVGTARLAPSDKEDQIIIWNTVKAGTGTTVDASTVITGNLVDSRSNLALYPIYHTHELSYSAKDEKITESCSSCGHTATAIVSIKEGIYYTGNAITDAVTVTPDAAWAGETPTIEYSNNTEIGTGSAAIKIGENTVATVTFPIIRQADTTELDALVETAEGLKAGDNYETVIPSVKTAFEAALEAAKSTQSNLLATQNDVNAAKDALQALVDKLPSSIQGNITGLEESIAQMEAIDKTKYTAESVEALEDVLTEAKKVLEKGEEATKEEVNSAMNAILNARNNLVPVAVTTPSPTPKPPVITPNPTQKPLPDNVPGGSTWKGDTIVTPNGTEVKPDGSIVLPDGTELKPDADGTKPSISKDGTVTDTNETSIKADGAIVLPGEDKADPKDDTIVTKGDGTKAPVYNSETGKVTVNGGNLVTHPGNMVQKPAAGSTVDSLGTITEPDGTKITSDGVTHRTDGGKTSYDGEILKPAIPIIESVRATGNAPIVELEDTVFGAFGYDFVVGTREDCIVTKDYLQIQKNKLLTETNFWYLPKGTYYFYCHAWFRNENGIKVFSGWSNAYEFEVTATTPAKPQIIKATVKGRNVTVTYRKAKDATGYDIVLGRAVRKVNGEFRPVDYGSYVKKNIDKDTVQVTFKNVKPGTYYVGMHAFNRTSTNKTKVFSPWSNRKTIKIRK